MTDSIRVDSVLTICARSMHNAAALHDLPDWVREALATDTLGVHYGGENVVRIKTDDGALVGERWDWLERRGGGVIVVRKGER